MSERYQVVWSDGGASDWVFTLEAAVAIVEDDPDPTGVVYDERECRVWSKGREGRVWSKGREWRVRGKGREWRVRPED